MSGAWLIGNGQVVRLRGEIGPTPPEPRALFKVNDVIKVRRLKHLRGLPEFGAIAAVVPIGYSPDWAWADLKGQPRPLMAEVGRRYVQYIVAFEGNLAPHLLREKYIVATDQPPAEIKVVP